MDLESRSLVIFSYISFRNLFRGGRNIIWNFHQIDIFWCFYQFLFYHEKKNLLDRGGFDPFPSSGEIKTKQFFTLKKSKKIYFETALKASEHQLSFNLNQLKIKYLMKKGLGQQKMPLKHLCRVKMVSWCYISNKYSNKMTDKEKLLKFITSSLSHQSHHNHGSLDPEFSTICIKYPMKW